jgi:hypothetical protein
MSEIPVRTRLEERACSALGKNVRSERIDRQDSVESKSLVIWFARNAAMFGQTTRAKNSVAFIF